MSALENFNTNVTRGGKSVYDSLYTYTNIKYGIVKALESDYGNKDTGLGRIKVYIKGPISTGGDGDISVDSQDAIMKLPWCYPLLPKHLQVTPKVGEVVWIITLGKENQHADRLYIGPIISQLPNLKNDPFLYSALAGFTFGPQSPDVNPAQIPEMKGIFPNPQDISIQGRYNTDITQKENEVVIRAGKFETVTTSTTNPFGLKFNANTQGYIQIKNDFVVKPKTNDQDQLKGSVTNIVSNKINLITHVDGSPRFNVLNQDNLISDDELTKVLSEAHQLPFGDILLQYLILLKEAFFAHVHNGSGNVPTDLTIAGNKQSVGIFKSKADDLEKSMLSKNIRIN